LFLPFKNDGIVIPDDMLTPFQHLFDLIVLENKGASDAQLLLKYTSAFLLHLFRWSDNPFTVKSHEDARMVKLFQLMERHYKDNRTAAFYAAQLGLTPKRINEILRDKAGMTMNQLLSRLLLIEAKRGLYHGVLSIKEIAYHLGFTDPSYFARFFKKQTGVTPEAFRAKGFGE
ncbi:MAG: helix-turn-helix domain-containing protein, partial [Sphingobacteriales bacterium]